MMGLGTICACQLAASGVHHTTAGRPFSDRRAAAQSNAKRVRRSSVQRAGVCMRRQRSQALDSSKTSETGWRTAPRHHPSRHTTGETRLARRGGEAAEVPWPGQAAPSRALFCFSANKQKFRTCAPAGLSAPTWPLRARRRPLSPTHPPIRPGWRRASPSSASPRPSSSHRAPPFCQPLEVDCTPSQPQPQSQSRGAARHGTCCCAFLLGPGAPCAPPCPMAGAGHRAVTERGAFASPSEWMAVARHGAC